MEVVSLGLERNNNNFTMKHITHSHIRMYLLIAVICALLAGAASVFAEDATSTDNDSATTTLSDRMAARKARMEERKAEMEARIEERKNRLEAKRAELQQRQEDRQQLLSERMQNRINTVSDNVTGLLERAIERLSGIIDRIENRAAELETDGVDTGDAMDILDEAKTKLNEASALLEGIDVDVDYIYSSDEPRTAWTELRDLFKEIHDMLREVRSLLKDAVAALKKAVRGDTTDGTDETDTQDTATSTDETE